MNLTLQHPENNSLIIKKAWEEFIHTGESTRDLPRKFILDSWKQSRDKGIDPNTERAPCALEPGEIDEQLNSQQLGVVGKSILDRVADSTFNTEHIVVLANSQGQILYSVGHKSVQKKLERINFMPGGSWSTEEVGPNGIGTPIAINKPELIYGSEHYCEAWQPWACYGSPVHNNSGEVIGAIDITGPANQLSMQTMSLAMSLAHSVESELNVLRLERREKLRQLYRQRKNQIINSISCLIDSQGCIVDGDAEIVNSIHTAYDIPSSSIANTKPEFWRQLDSAMKTGVDAEITVNLNNYQERFIVELLFESKVCLGAILIKDSLNEYSNYEFPVKTGSSSSGDFKSHGDQVIRDALEKTGGNISKAARMLGINRTTIYRRLKLLKSN